MCSGPLPPNANPNPAPNQDRFPRERVSMPVPILLAITDFTRRQIGEAKAVTLTSAAGTPLAILRAPETYEYRAREVIYRTWGAQDDKHPYIQHMLAPGKTHCLGGEVELLGRIKYSDGLPNPNPSPSPSPDPSPNPSPNPNPSPGGPRDLRAGCGAARGHGSGQAELP